MSKLNNFFLALFVFFLMSVIFYIVVEITWVERDTDVFVSVPKTARFKHTSAHEADPNWLIPLKQINFHCDHPWVIPRTISLHDFGIDELINAGLSECYQLAGEMAIESHLWHQGKNTYRTKFPSMGVQTETAEIFFDHNTDFQKLGLKIPEWVSVSGRLVHDWNGDAGLTLASLSFRPFGYVSTGNHYPHCAWNPVRMGNIHSTISCPELGILRLSVHPPIDCKNLNIPTN